MLRRVIGLAAIGLIFFCVSTARMILGASTSNRASSADGDLESKLAGIWGDWHRQQPPEASFRVKKGKNRWEKRTLPMIGGDLKVDFKLTHRQKGLIQAVYLVASSYTFFFRGDIGLSITIGAVISVAAMMQLTAKVD